MRKALFLDRDGVINKDAGYIYRPEDIIFNNQIFVLARAASAHNYLIIVITNQAGIGRGFYSEADFHALMQWMSKRFAQENAPLAAYYFCPHHAEHGQGIYREACNCRKPRPGMLLQAKAEWDIDMPASIMIGDNESDMQAAQAAGVGTCVLWDDNVPLHVAL